MMKMFNQLSEDLAGFSTSGATLVLSLLKIWTQFSKTISSPAVCLLIEASAGKAFEFFSLSILVLLLNYSSVRFHFGVLTLIQYIPVLDEIEYFKK